MATSRFLVAFAYVAVSLYAQNSPLIRAIVVGNEARALDIIRHEPRTTRMVARYSGQLFTPLTAAARFDRNPDTPIINALLEANSGNLSPFLETPAQFGLTPALVAIAAKNPDALVHLLDAGASLNPSPGMNLRELLVNKPPWGIIETGGEAVVEPIDAQRCLYIIQMHDPSLIRDNIPREMKSSAPLKAVMTSNVKPKRTKGVIISKIGRSIYNRFSRPNRESSTGTVVDNPLHAF